ncbi:hypothetical protein [Streptomyces sp. NPDC021012]|uniref:hypothetical protein n=1 Tax=unclassified Streptomyces TaxID=2593676 RepID=UPI00379CB0DB
MLHRRAEQDPRPRGAELVGRCLKGFGADWKPAPELPATDPKNLLDWRHGIHGAGMSAEFGYQVEPAQQAR